MPRNPNSTRHNWRYKDYPNLKIKDVWGKTYKCIKCGMERYNGGWVSGKEYTLNGKWQRKAGECKKNGHTKKEKENKLYQKGDIDDSR